MKLLVVLLLLASCGKQVTKKYVENPYDNSANEARILELEDKLEANDITIGNLNTAIAELTGDQSELIKMIELLKEANAKLLAKIKRLKCKKKD